MSLVGYLLFLLLTFSLHGSFILFYFILFLFYSDFFKHQLQIGAYVGVLPQGSKSKTESGPTDFRVCKQCEGIVMVAGDSARAEAAGHCPFLIFQESTNPSQSTLTLPRAL